MNGRRLAPQEIRPDSLVTIQGVTTNVCAAMAAGLIRQSESGQYIGKSGESAAAPQQQQQQQQEQEQTPAPAVAEPMAPEVEAVLTEAMPKLSQGTRNAIVTEAIANGSLSTELTQRVAEQLGISTDEAGDRIGKVLDGFAAQAHASIGSMAPQVLGWARQERAKELNDAMRNQAMNGTTSGFKALARDFLENLPTIPGGADAIINHPDAQAWGARKERDGRVTVQTKSMGRVDWRTAMRSPSLGFKPTLK